MYIILTYDIEAKRVSKVMKICRKYLRHVQKSVFEGNITPSVLNKLKCEIERVVNFQKDSVVIYEFESLRFAAKEHIGCYEKYTNVI